MLSSNIDEACRHFRTERNAAGDPRARLAEPLELPELLVFTHMACSQNTRYITFFVQKNTNKITKKNDHIYLELGDKTVEGVWIWFGSA